MKYVLAAFCFIISIAFFSSCKNDRKLKIGFLLRNEVQERCIEEKKFFTERITQLGHEAVIMDANNDDQKQIAQGYELIKQGVKVLVIFPLNLNTSAAIIREAHQHNVKVIAYESLIQNCDLDYYISADNEKGGVLMAEYMTKHVPAGNYVLLGGDKSDRNAVLIKNGQLKVLQPFIQQGKIKVIYDSYSDWTSSEGFHEISRVLSLSGITPDVIMSSNDGLATGVVQALKDEGLSGKIPVTGLDADLVGCQRVANGSQTITVFKSFKKQAYAAAEMAVQIASNKKPQNINAEIFNGVTKVPTFLIEPVVVDKNNLNEVIVKGGVFTEKEVYGSSN